MLKSCNWIIPEWPAHPRVKALTTLRMGGHSLPPYEGFNLAMHVGDDPKAVSANRALLFKAAHLPKEPKWLTQVHGITVLDVVHEADKMIADAAVSSEPNQVCAVLTADCLPILLCDAKGEKIGAVHAGWRGLAAGIIKEAVKKLACHPSTLLAWLGPAIGPAVYEVGSEVLDAFPTQQDTLSFRSIRNGVWLANLYDLAKKQLNQEGITQIFGGEFCTYSETERFYSFRRSKQTGRMATLIWLDEPS